MIALDDFKNTLLRLRYYSGDLEEFSYDPNIFEIFSDSNKEYLHCIRSDSDCIYTPNRIKELYTIFSYCDDLIKVNIPESVWSIGSVCFSDCTNLRSVNLPKHLTALSINCFSNCQNIVKIDILDSITVIEKRCFYSYINLKEIKIPKSIKSLGIKCFA